MFMQMPVPHQVLLESRYLPQVWEQEIVLRTYFSKFGEVTGVARLGFQRFIVSFKVSRGGLISNSRLTMV